VAGNLHTSEEMLVRLAADPAPEVRANVAKTHQCPPDLLEGLVQDVSPAVRWHVAANPNTPADVLEWLFDNDDNAQVRVAVINRHDVPADWLRAASADCSSTMRLHVVYHRHCPRDVLDTLCQDPDVRVRRAAIRVCSLSALAAQVDDTDYKVRAEVASRCPQYLERLSYDEHWEVRRAVTDHPACLPEILSRLSCDGSQAVRKSAASNANCPPQTLLSLLRDSNQEIARAAAQNSGLPKHALAMWQLAHSAN